VKKNGLWQWVAVWVVLLLMISACGGGGESSSGEGNNADGKANLTPENSASATPPTKTSTNVNGENTSDAPPEVAAIVNGTPILYPDFQREVTALLQGSGLQPANMAAFETDILNAMINQVLIEQYAETNGIRISDEAVQAEIASLNQLAAQNQTDLAAVIGYPADMVNDKVYELLITQAVSQHVADSVPLTAPQIHARHILVKDEALAYELLEQLNAGADFADLATRYSQDFSSARAGGDLGWISPGDLLQAEVERVIFEMPVNSRWPEPVQTVLGYHIIESLERVEDRPLDETRRTQQRRELFNTWLAEQIATAEITRFVGVDANP
jgi:peptidyl-prolyl cis-trans isomerase C